MCRKDVFAVKNGNCYEYMTYNRRQANNRLIISQDMEYRLGGLTKVKLVHPPESAVKLYALANGPLDR